MAQIFRTLSVLLTLLLIGCGTTKNKFVTSTATKTDSTYTKRDSIVKTTISLGIKDTVFLPISTGSKQLDSVLTKRLEHFKTGKKSGANSYAIRYDTKAKGFQITSTIQKTKNEIQQKHDSIYQEKATEVRKEHKELKTRTRVPMWLLITFIILLLVVYVLAKMKII